MCKHLGQHESPLQDSVFWRNHKSKMADDR